MRILVLALLLGSARADNSVAAGVVELSFHTTPGKPMELARPGHAAEEIVARRGRLVVSRNVGPDYEEASAELSDAEWRSLVAIVEAQRLLRWKAVSTSEEAADYSSSGFAILGANEKELNRQTWSRPTRDLERPYRLAAALAALARKKIRKPVLFYLVP